jgi:Ca-activated chloride channel family protein
MKQFVKKLSMFCLLLLILVGTDAYGKITESEDKTLSPYFFVQSDDPDVDQLPLKSTAAVVNISGVIADVKVTQVYKNEGKRPLEAIYVFPASTRAAVYGMNMTIGERTITAKIEKREAARQAYEDAKHQGRSASLLEQQRPNVFQMNVANILPGDVIKVELSYTELLVPTEKTYEFVYPTVVGPRYSNQPEETASTSEQWIQNPYLRQGETPQYTFDMNVNIATGLPIQEMYCTSHKVHVNYDGPSIATIKLDQSEQYGGNRDYILKYRLDGEQIESGLLLYEGYKEKFFLLMVQPPERIKTSQIPKREYIFIVDVSGSMHGFPLDISKKLLKDLIGNLRPTDTFNILLFAGGSSVMSEHSLSATSQNINRAINVIEKQRGGGGTELLPALQRALALPKAEGCSRTVVIATDGYVTVEEETFDLIRENLGNANMFAFGIGSSVNRHLIEGMARAGMGEPFIITKPEEAPAKAETFRNLIQTPVLTQIKINFDRFKTYNVEPISIPDVLAERPVVVFGKWRGNPEGKITVRGISGNKPFKDVIDVNKVTPSEDNAALRYLWARYRIALLSDYNKLRSDDKRIQEVTEIGLTYNLLTAYTSFIAIDTEIRNKDGQLSTVKQPLPLPQGVSDYAVGGALKESFAPSSYRMNKQAVAKDEKNSVQSNISQRSEGEKGVKIGEIITSGSLSKELMHKTLEQHLHKFQKCYRKIHPLGKLIVKLIIRVDGTVKSVNVVSSELKDRKAQQCMTQKIKKWKFPVRKGSREVTATVSFIFR